MTTPRVQQQQLFEWITGQEPTQDEITRFFSVGTSLHLAAYRRNHLYNRTAALSAAFPVVSALVGERFFQEMARGYVENQRAVSPDLHQNGADFPDWIADYAPAADLGYLSAVATLDWCVHQAFYAADAAPFDTQQLANIPPEQIGELRFQFAPAAAVLPSVWPIASIWAYHQPDSPRQPVEMTPTHHGVLVSRQGGRVQVEALTAADLAAMLALRAGKPFEHAVDAGLAITPDYQPLGTLQQLIQQGALASAYLPAASNTEDNR